MIVFRDIEKTQLESVEKLASTLWKAHYSHILSEEQIDFMLKMFQSVDSMSEQIENGYHYVGLYDDLELAGYYAVQEQSEFFFLSKIYFSSRIRGHGCFKKALEDMSRFNPNGKPIKLTVNRFNPSANIYLNVGFKVVGEEKKPIGNSYFMDDFIMVK